MTINEKAKKGQSTWYRNAQLIVHLIVNDGLEGMTTNGRHSRSDLYIVVQFFPMLPSKSETS